MKPNYVGVFGGLGNQLFQYAFARWLEQRSGRPSVLDLSSFRTRPGYLGLADLGLTDLRADRRLDLLPFPLGRLAGLGTATRVLLGPGHMFVPSHPSPLVDEAAIRRRGWWYGYWQEPSYIQEAIPALRAEIWREALPIAEPSIGMHVRRGDMVATASVLDADYYISALATLRRAHPDAVDAHVTVYSDDPGWCRTNMPIDGAVYLEPGSAGADLRRLAQHRFLVLSGSTFSWWAAQLLERDRATVVAPEPFSNLRGQQLELPGWLHQSRRVDA